MRERASTRSDVAGIACITHLLSLRVMSTRCADQRAWDDRKDMKHPAQKSAGQGETGGQRAKRRKKVSDNLDEALKETFRNSHPVSPFSGRAIDAGDGHRMGC